MKTALPTLICFALTAALAQKPATAARCSLQPLVPHGSSVDIGAAKADLGDADRPSTPTSWQGPLKAGACSFGTGIIEQPMAATPAGLLYVTTYSGSMRRVTLFDLHTCSVRWKSEPFAGTVALTDAALTLGRRRIALDEQCLPEHKRSRR